MINNDKKSLEKDSKEKEISEDSKEKEIIEESKEDENELEEQVEEIKNIPLNPKNFEVIESSPVLKPIAKSKNVNLENIASSLPLEKDSDEEFKKYDSDYKQSYLNNEKKEYVSSQDVQSNIQEPIKVDLPQNKIDLMNIGKGEQELRKADFITHRADLQKQQNSEYVVNTKSLEEVEKENKKLYKHF